MPALKVSYPRTNWKYCVTRNVNPNRQKNAMPIPPVAALNRAFLKNFTSKSGFSFFDSKRTKPINANTAMPKPKFDFALPHPQCGDSITVKTSALIATTDNTKPTLSSLCAFGLRESGINRAPTTREIATIGKLIKKTDPHQKCSSMKPPTTGPNATAIPDTADQIPMAFARSIGSINKLVMIASVAGNTSAAPMPIAPRQKINELEVSANAAMPLHAANNTSPICSVRLRPYRSPIPPPASNRPAKTNA